MKRLPQLPALDTQATIQEYFAISGASAGPTWPYVFPLAEWRRHIPTLPDGEWGVLYSSDHSGGTGYWYLDTTDSATPETGWSGSPTNVFSGVTQNEMPVLNLNKRLGVVEVIPHISAGSKYGWTNEQQDKVYHTTDFATFTLQGDLEVEGAYTTQHPGYGQIFEDNGVEYFLKTLFSAEHFGMSILRRDRQDQPWKWDGRRLGSNQAQITGATVGRCIVGSRAFQWLGQWYRLGILCQRPRLTASASNRLEIIAYPVKGDGDYHTPLGGYQTLVQEAASHFIVGQLHPVVKDGVLYIFYTERNTGTSQNRIRVAYNSTATDRPNPASPATFTAPYARIYPDGRLWEEKAATVRYAHTGGSTNPSWATLTQDVSTASISEDADGFKVSAGSVTSDWTWGVASGNAINPSSGGVLLATWKGLKRRNSAKNNFQIGFASAPSSAGISASSTRLFFSDSETARLDGEFSERRSSATAIEDVFPYADDFGDTRDFASAAKDVSVAIWDNGTRFGFFIDGSCQFIHAMTASIGAVVPYYRAIPGTSNAQNMWTAWQGFEFVHLNAGSPLAGSAIDQIEAIIRREVQAALAPLQQMAADSTSHHRELSKLGDTRRAVTNR